ncbi:MAG: aminoglycoside phosphotransferase family protein [Planctomycetes bacterium]|nr:aminoglycoside phosphotransferase family protein [Planctomycetota bacterium]
MVDNIAEAPLQTALVRMGLIKANDHIEFEALTGGVASDIWKVQTPEQCFCLKRALAELKVEQQWSVSTERNNFEVKWFQYIAEIIPQLVPAILGHDLESQTFAMEYFEPAAYPVLKQELFAGRMHLAAVGELATQLACIHQQSSQQADLARTFNNHQLFHDLRIDPYFVSTLNKHQHLEEHIAPLTELLRTTHTALVHGDVSPKNILIGDTGPILLDAECAVYGDPAFDLAFLLNHFLLKSVNRKELHQDYLQAFTLIVDSYLENVQWEESTALEQRAARYLGVLLLARIDGKSPVEYITEDHDKDFVRNCAGHFISQQIDEFSEIKKYWLAQINTKGQHHEQ